MFKIAMIRMFEIFIKLKKVRRILLYSCSKTYKVWHYSPRHTFTHIIEFKLVAKQKTNPQLKSSKSCQKLKSTIS